MCDIKCNIEKKIPNDIAIVDNNAKIDQRNVDIFRMLISTPYGNKRFFNQKTARKTAKKFTRATIEKLYLKW